MSLTVKTTDLKYKLNIGIMNDVVFWAVESLMSFVSHFNLISPIFFGFVENLSKSAPRGWKETSNNVSVYLFQI